jgi:polysaccharide biosynthesis protein PelA
MVGLFSAPMLQADPQTRLMVDLSAKPASLGLSAFDLCVLRVDAAVDLEAAHALGNKCLARVPIFEVPTTSAAAMRAQSLGVPLLDGSVKGMSRLDATHPRWSSVVVHELVEEAAERGFDGVVLTELNTISQDAERAAVLQVLEILKSAYPDKLLFIENGFDLLSEGRRSLDGILLVESTEKGEVERTAWRVRGAARLGVQPYVVAFADPENLANVAERTSAFREMGGIPFFTTPALEGVNLGPLQEISRRILVLHSRAARETFTAKILHGSLEWLGYDLIYQDAGTATTQNLLPAHISVNGVILDQSLQLTPERQKNLADMVVHLVGQKVPVLLNGMPWQQEAEILKVLPALGLRGTGQKTRAIKNAAIRHTDSAFLMEQGSLTPRISDLRDLQASADSQVLMSVRNQAEGVTTHDQVFISPWGGVWLDPLAMEAGPQISPVLFLESWLAAQPLMPVADTTSLDGRRLLVSHISSEGFADTTSLPGMPIAAEAMTERVLKRYALPFTVALCEGDLCGWTPGHEPREALRLQEAARTMLSFAEVETASQSFSRPESWAESATLSGALNASAPKAKKGLEREIMGSLAYLHREFLGHSDRVAVMSWPQGSVPSAEAVAFSRQMGVENAEIIHQSRFSGRQAAPAPRTWGHEATFQTLLTEARIGDSLNAAAFIAEAQTLPQNRWLSPVQVTLSFKDAQTEGSLQQVERLLNWCASQPLQAITVGEYARLTRDAARTRIFQTGPARWIIVNAGYARTLRLPASAGVPNLALCTGVSGYVQQGDQIYIHTLGLRRTELIMSEKPILDHLRLTSSSSSVRYLESASSRALLQVSHSRPVEMSFDGIAPGSIIQMIANGKPDYLMADTRGSIDFIVPGQATVQLRILPAHESVMR